MDARFSVYIQDIFLARDACRNHSCLFQAGIHFFNENILTLNYKRGDVNTRQISMKIYLKDKKINTAK